VKLKLTIASEELRLRALTIIKALSLEPVHEIIIHERKKDRSLEQNALYWKWLTVIGAELGESKEALHEHYKEKFLINIYERDCPDFAEMVQSLRAVWHHGMKEEALSLRKKIVALTSTSTANTHQMSEYMTAIEHDAASLAIHLPHPEDL